MTDTATMQAQLDALYEAYRSGARTVSYEGKSVTYGTADDLRAAIASLESQLGLSTAPKSIVVRSSKGW